MAINLGAAYVDIVPSTGNLASQLRRETEPILSRSGGEGGTSWGSSFVDTVSGFAGRAFDAVSATFRTGLSAVGLSSGISLGAAFFSGFSRFTALENAETMLSQLGLNADQVDGLMGSLNDTLTGTAFALDEGAGVLARLVSAGAPLEDIPGVLDSIADAAAFGQAPIGEIGDIFARVQSQGRVTAMELNRLALRNIPAFELLADSMGLGVDELRDMVSAGDLDAATFFQAWEDGAQGFGENNIQMAGAAQAMGDTTSGALSNLQAALARFGARAFAPIFEGIRPAADALRGFLDDAAPRVEAFVSRVIELFNTFRADGLAGVWEEMRPVLAGALQSLGQWIVDAVPIIARHLQEWGQAFVEWVLPRIPPMLRELGRLLGALGSWVLDTGLPLLVEHLLKWGQAFVEWLAPMIPPLLVELGKLLADLGNWIIDEALPTIIAKLLEWGLAFAGWVVDAGAELISALWAWWWEDGLPWFAGLPERIFDALVALPGQFFDFGKESAQRFIEGLEDGFAFRLGGSFNPLNWGANFGGNILRRMQGRANGGPVTAGRPYLVGENGIEMFVPARSGHIIPNDTLTNLAAPAMAGAPTFNNTINTEGLNPEAALELLNRHLGWQLSMAGVR